MGLLVAILQAYEIIIFARAIVSWFSPNPNSAVYRFLVEITEPVLGPIRKLLPQSSSVDFSPLIALLLIHFVKSLIA